MNNKQINNKQIKSWITNNKTPSLEGGRECKEVLRMMK
jgi:hypothetical protein